LVDGVGSALSAELMLPLLLSFDEIGDLEGRYWSFKPELDACAGGLEGSIT
jgi:hypothetical protein